MDDAVPPVKVDTAEIKQAVADELRVLLPTLHLATTDEVEAMFQRLMGPAVQSAVNTALSGVRLDIEGLRRDVTEAQRQAKEFLSLATEIKAALGGINTSVSALVEQAKTNAASINNLDDRTQRIESDLYGNTRDPESRSVMKEIRALPAAMKAAIDAALAPVIEEQRSLRKLIEEISRWVFSRKAWEQFLLRHWRKGLAALVWGGSAYLTLKANGYDLFEILGLLFKGGAK